MSKFGENLGVQSYCFRAFKDNAKVAGLVKELGLKSIEVCAVHVDFNEPAQHEPCINAYRDAGVQIVCIGVETFTGDEAAARKRFDFAKKAGAGFISANLQPDSWQEAVKVIDKLSKEYGIRCGIHNHGGYHWLGNAQMLKHVFANSGDGLGLWMDTAWALHSGEDPIKWCDLFGDRLFGVHIKDFTFNSAGKGEDVVVGTGNLDLPKLMEKLKALDVPGHAVLEYEGDVNDPVPALKQCVEKVRAADR